jgi:exosortase
MAMETGQAAPAGGRATVGALAPREWLLLGLLAVAFTPALFALAGVWATVDYQSHGFLVPVVSLWVALRERRRWRRLERSGDWRGALALAASLLLLLAGASAGLVALQGLALVVAVTGAVWLTRGTGWLRALAFPLAFLIFLVPVPGEWIAPTIVRLQLFVSWASEQLLHAFGVLVHRDGNVIQLPGGESLFVAEACSGVTSIVTLLPLAVLLAHFTLRRWWTTGVLVLSVAPIAMLGNLLRVIATVLVARRVGVDLATEGPVHETAGLLTYLAACGLMVAVGALLRRVERGWSASPRA